MGNTNLPQFGAADTRNSRDTLTGDRQLTDEERNAVEKTRSVDADSARNGNAADASNHAADTVGREPDRSSDAVTAQETMPDNPVHDESIEDKLAGHVDPGRSPSGAT